MSDEQLQEAPESPAPSASDTGSDAAQAGANQTLADGGGSDDAAPPATWPPDWRDRFAGTDEDFRKQLNRYKSPENLAKSWREQRRMIDGKALVRARPETDDPEALAAWRAEIGVPEELDEYKKGLPEDIAIPEEDAPFVDKYLDALKSEGISAKEAAKGLEVYYEMRAEADAAQEAKDKEHRATSEELLRMEWGPEYRPNMTAMNSLLDAFGTENLKEKLFSARTADGLPLGDDADVLQFLVGVAKEINPAATVIPINSGDQRQTVADRMKEIMSHPDYWHDEGMQEEWRRLSDAQDKMERRAS